MSSRMHITWLLQMHFSENTACLPAWREPLCLISLYAAIDLLMHLMPGGAGEMYTPRVGENTVHSSPPLSPRAPPTCSLLALIHPLHSSESDRRIHHRWKNRLFKQILQSALNLNAFGGKFEYGRWAGENRGSPPRTATTLPLCCANEQLCTNCSFSNQC